MERHWNVLERVLLQCFVVGLQVEVQCLLVGEVPIELQMVMCSESIRWCELPKQSIRLNFHRVVISRVLEILV